MASARVPQGAYLLSLELLDAERDRAWRARHGVSQEALPAGLIALSDLLLLEPDHAAPSGEPLVPREEDALEAHLQRALPQAVATEDRVEVAWEAYGLTGGETVAFEVTADSDERGLGRRLGEFLGLLDDRSPVRVSWTETVRSNEVQAVGSSFFRRLVVDLASLPSGPIRLTVALRVAGRTPATSTVVINRPERS